MLLPQFIIGTVLITVTVIIHAIILDRIMLVLEKTGKPISKIFKRLWRIPVLVIAVLGTFASHIIHIWIWAFFYLNIENFHTLESALYFSTSVFTTVGFGDIVLDENWRLISSFQAANGFILFGWSTAFIFEVMSRLYQQNSFKSSKISS